MQQKRCEESGIAEDIKRRVIAGCRDGTLRVETDFDASPTGKLGFRCPGEPVETYLKRGGTVEATKNKLCLCNGLLATVGLGQRRTLGDELPILTAGEGLREVLAYLPAGKSSYSARNVMEQLVAR